ncbi:hypothetical protein V6238_01485 [Marinomonas arenicola]|uniref:hypothetical protein n=1 Tax=Marinomonas arenicola TaxID=569601 RepID=UPI00311FB977
MIERIRYIGLEVKDSSFKKFDVKSEGGSINLEVTPSTVIVRESEASEKTVFFSIPVKAKMSGDDKMSGDQVFICEADLDVDFVYEKNENIEYDEKALVDITTSHDWYFENYIAISVKSSLEAMLEHTIFNGIEVPVR